MLNYKSLDKTTNESIRNMIEGFEGFVPFVYHDSKGVPTLGIGFALIIYDENDTSGPWVFKQEYFNRITNNEIILSDSQILRLERAAEFLNNDEVDQAKALFPDHDANIVADPSLNTMGLTISRQQGDEIFDRTIKEGVENLYKQLGRDLFFEVAQISSKALYTTADDVVAAFSAGDIPGSKEFVSLLSMAFNLPSLIGTGITDALTNGDRTRAWFEIRYVSNGGDESGIQKRRFYESEFFGLFDNQTDISIQANDIIDFLFDQPGAYFSATEPRNIDRIIRIEEAFYNAAYNADRDFNLFGQEAQISYGRIFKSIATELLNRFAPELNGIVDTNDMSGDVNIGVKTKGGSDLHNYIQPLYRWGMAFSPQQNESTFNDNFKTKFFHDIEGINDLLIALDGADAYIQGLYGDDVLVGADGSDHLYGGYQDELAASSTRTKDIGDDTLVGNDGADHLYGQLGNDLLMGGEGNDHYYFNYGDDNDVVVDSAGANALHVQHTENGAQVKLGGTLTQLIPGSDVYAQVNAAGQPINNTKYTLNRSTNGSIASMAISVDGGKGGQITLSGFTAGQFGLSLQSFSDPVAPALSANPNQIDTGTIAESEKTDTTQRKFGSENRNDNASFVYDAATYSLNKVTDEDYSGELFLAFEGGTANDVLVGGNRYDLSGTFGDLLYGHDGDDVIRADFGMDSDEERDVLIGGKGSDQIFGGASTDYIFGTNNVLLDFVSPYTTLAVNQNQVNENTGDKDFLSGGGGDDYLLAGNGDDTALGGEDHDLIVTAGGRDLINGGDGNDRIYSDSFGIYRSYSGGFSILPKMHSVFDGPLSNYNDTVDGGSGNDEIISGAGDDFVYGGLGNDQLQGDRVNSPDWHEINAGGFTETIEQINERYTELNAIYHGDDYLSGGMGDDTIFGNGGDDFIDGGEDNDSIFGDDIYLIGEHHGKDEIFGGEGNDLIVAGGNIDTVYGGKNDDVIFGDDFVTASSFHGDDRLFGNEGNDYIIGGGGADTIFGGNGNDYLTGDNIPLQGFVLGEDFIDGPRFFTFNDTQYDFRVSDVDQKRDEIFGGRGNDALFGDGGNDLLDGGEDDDYIYGGLGDDEIRGGKGDDYLNGGAGNDKYIFHAGDGLDILSDKFGVELHFTEGNLSTRLDPYQGSLQATISYGEGDSIFLDLATYNALEDVFVNGEKINLVDTLDLRNAISVLGTGASDTFTLSATGSAFNLAAGGLGDDIFVADKTGGYTLEGGEGNDIYQVSLLNQTIDINLQGDDAGGDIISVSSGVMASDILASREQDTLLIYVLDPNRASIDFNNTTTLRFDDYFNFDRHFSGVSLDGSDFISEAALLENIATIGDDSGRAVAGSERDDILIGNKGDDLIFGQGGSNTYIYHRGDGNDVISHYDTAQTINTLKLEDLPESDVTVRRQYQDLHIEIDDGSRITIRDHFSGNATQLDQIIFSDDTVWDITTISDFVLLPTDNNDVIYGNELDNEIDGAGGNDTIYGYEGNDQLTGGLGDDYLEGGAGDDTLVAGKGNDTIRGGAGNNTYVYRLGDGNDTINHYNTDGSVNQLVLEDLSESDIIVRRSFDSLVVKINDGSQIFISNHFRSIENTLDQISFPNGTVWNKSDIAGLVLLPTDENDYLVGDDTGNQLEGLGGNDDILGRGGDDTLFGSDGNDRLEGDAGNDRLFGGADNDGLTGGDGDDILAGGKGDDTLRGGSGNDTYLYADGDGHDNIVQFFSDQDGTDGIVFDDTMSRDDVRISRDAGDLIILKGETKLITVSQYFSGRDHLDYIEFASGEVLDKQALLELTKEASNYNDYILGSNADDHISGLGGDDFLAGGAGNDTYFYDLGDGNDQITDSSGIDKLVLGTNIQPEHVVLRRNDLDGLTLFISDPNQPDAIDTVMINAYFYNSTANTIEFSDGTVWNDTFIQSAVRLPTDADDNIIGDSDNNSLAGGLGNDRIVADAGDDTLAGGQGNDLLYGGLGSDRYVFDSNFGQDLIIDRDSDPQSIDTIFFGDAFSQDDIIFVREANGIYTSPDLIIIDPVSHGRISVQGFFYTYGSPSEKVIEFSDGTILNKDDILRTFFGGSDRNDYIEGNSEANVLTGGLGDDVIVGRGGDDTLIGGKGNDRVSGVEGNDTIVYRYGDGFDIVTDDFGTHDISYTLRLDNIKLLDITIHKITSNSLNVSLNDGTGAITIEGALDNTGSLSTLLNSIEFSDGTSLDREGITNLIADPTAADDYIRGTSTGETLFGLDGNDTIYGLYGQTTLVGGKGNDWLIGSTQSSTYLIELEDGMDSLSIYGQDTLVFGESISPSDVKFFETNGIRYISVNGTSQLISVGLNSFDATLDIQFSDEPGTVITLETPSFGEAFDQDTYYQIISNDVDISTILDAPNNRLSDAVDVNGIGMYASIDDDAIFNTTTDIFASLGDDIVVSAEDGHGGVDIIDAGLGSDYVYGGDQDTFILGGSNDPSYPSFFSESDYGGLPYPELTDEGLYPADGNDSLWGEGGNDQIHGGLGNDFISGGRGNDKVAGGQGNDTYGFSYGDGQDTVISREAFAIEFSTQYSAADYSDDYDVLQLGKGVTAEDIIIGRSNDNLAIKLKRTNDSFTVENYFSSVVNESYGIREIHFDDGTTWTDTEILLALETTESYAEPTTLSVQDDPDVLDLTGSDDSEVIIGNTGPNNLEGEGGDDALYGGSGNDDLSGGSGKNLLFGEGGDDFLTGGTDSDYFVGGNGNDTYFFSAGFGKDIIDNYDDTKFYGSSIANSAIDKIVLDQSIDRSNVIVLQDKYDLIIQHGLDELRVLNHFLGEGYGLNQRYGIDNIEFSDGVSWDGDEIKNRIGQGSEDLPPVLTVSAIGVVEESISVGTQVATFSATDPDNDDVFLSLLGNDDNYFVLGDNVILLTREGVDAINDDLLDLSSISVQLQASSQDKSVTSDITVNVERVNDNAPTANSDSVATEEDNTIQIAISELLANDSDLDGGSLSIASLTNVSGGAAELSSDGQFVIFTPVHNFNGEAIFEYTVSDEDGRESSAEVTVNVSAVNDAPTAIGIQSAIEATEGDTIIETLPDSLFVDVDGDSLSYSLTLANGDALPSWIIFNSDTRTLESGQAQLGNISVRLRATDSFGVSAFTDFDINVTKNKIIGTNDNDTLTGTDRADLLQGLAGSDILNGGFGDDELRGGSGSDTLIGGEGNDVYVVSSGDQSTEIDNFDSSESIDVLQFSEGISPTDISVQRIGDDLEMQLLSTNEIITIQNYFESENHEIDQVAFADGTTWDKTTLVAYAMGATDGSDTISAGKIDSQLYGLAGNDILQGNKGDDYIDGGIGDDNLAGDKGNDIIFGGQGNDNLDGGKADDRLYGGDGNDLLFGDKGNDTLFGGNGDDRLSGGKGDDTFIFEHDFGQDIVSSGSSESGNDTLQFLDISFESLWFSRDADNLLINVEGTDNKVLLEDWYAHKGEQVDQIVTEDGLLDVSQIEALVSAMASFNVPSGVGTMITQDVREQIAPVLAQSWNIN